MFMLSEAEPRVDTNLGKLFWVVSTVAVAGAVAGINIGTCVADISDAEGIATPWAQSVPEVPMARQVMWPWRYHVPLVMEVARVAEAAEIPSELPVVPPAVVSTFQSCVQVPGVELAVVMTP